MTNNVSASIDVAQKFDGVRACMADFHTKAMSSPEGAETKNCAPIELAV